LEYLKAQIDKMELVKAPSKAQMWDIFKYEGYEALVDKRDEVASGLWEEESERKWIAFTVRKLREGEALWENRGLPSAGGGARSQEVETETMMERIKGMEI
jgi:hypothetical protein